MSKQNMPPVIKQKKKILGFFPRRQTIVFLVVFTLIGSSAILYQILSTRGANYSWFQTAWSGGASTTATASHDSDQTDWDKYYSKDDNVSTSTEGQLTLSAVTSSVTDTTFSGSATDNTYIDNGTVKLKKPDGVACVSQDECMSHCGADNICGGLKPDGLDCVSDGECNSGYCINNICKGSLSIGDAYQGGIVFYVSGGHGLIAQTNDIGSNIQWGCYGTTINGADSTIDGAQNTIDIVNGCAETSRAARLCSDSTEGGYTDWYLPARTQTFTLYNQKDIVGNFSSTAYWTSSEYSSNQAYSKAFVSTAANAVNKNYSLGVRCIRSF